MFRKINTYILLFLVIVGGIISLSSSFVQSEFIGDILSKRITYYLKNKVDGRFKFSRAKVGFFPPATILKGVEIELSSGELKLKASEVAFYFSFLDFFSNKVSVNEVRLEDSIVDLGSLKSKKKASGEGIDYKLFLELVNTEMGIEIKKLTVHNSYILFDENQVQVDTLHLEKGDEEEVILRGKVGVESKLLNRIGRSKLKNKNIYEVDFDLILRDELILVEQITISDMYNLIKIEGSYQKKFKGTISASIYANDLVRNLDVGIPGNVGGLFEIEATVEGDRWKVNIQGKKLHTKYGYAEKIDLSLRVDDELKINKLRLKERSSTIELIRPSVLYSFKKKKILNNPFSFRLSEVQTNHAMFAIKKTLDPLKGRITGDVDVWWANKGIVFELQDGLELKGLRLNFGDGQDFLKHPKVTFNRSRIVVYKNFNIGLDLALWFKNSYLKCNGLVRKDGINLTTKESSVDFSELGEISGTQLKGHGPVEMEINGEYEDDIKFKIKSDLSDFSVLGFNFEQMASDIEISLLEKSLKIILGEDKKNGIKTKGIIRFDKKNLDLGFNISSTPYSYIRKVVAPIVAGRSYVPKKLDGNIFGNLRVSGNFSEDSISVSGKLNIKDLLYKFEEFKSVGATFRYEKEVLEFTKVKVLKGRGILEGDASINGETGYYEYDARVYGLRPDDIDLFRTSKMDLEGEIIGEFYGNGIKNDFTTRSYLKLITSSIAGKSIDDSSLTLFTQAGDYYLTAGLLGQQLSIDSLLSKKKRSYFNMAIKSDDLGEVFGLFWGRKKKIRSMKGHLQGSINSSFKFDEIDKMTLDLKIDELLIDRDGVNLKKIDGKNILSINNGKVIKNEIEIAGTGGKISLLVNGALEGGFGAKQDFDLDARFVKLINPKIKKISGRLAGDAYITGNIKKLRPHFNMGASIRGENIFVIVDAIPGSFEKMNFKILWNNEEILIEKFDAAYGLGKVDAQGRIVLGFPFPSVDINLQVKNSRIPLYKRSSVTINSEISLKGNRLPYLASGDIYMQQGEILEEFDELAKGDDGEKKYDKYTPSKLFDRSTNYLAFNIRTIFLNPLHLKNRMVDLYFNGKGTLVGNLNQPLIEGRFDLIPSLSRVSFKGNDFALEEGRIEFRKDYLLIPNLFFSGASRVGKHDISLKVAGDTDDLKIKFSSEPYLSQEDIFSLLTLGFTTDITDKLEDREREQVTTAGLGGLLMDQLRLSEGMTDSLGLKLSILPEFGESEDLLQGKAATGGSSSKLKSTTKIKVQKRIRKNVDLSVSSTLGGSLEQKQEVNINYNISDILSLEGIYEVKDGTIEEQGEESVGADIKWKWSF